MIVRRYLHQHGFRYRVHVASLPGRPDVVLAKHRVVVFVHGCFWHRHEGCSYARDPKSNQAYWIPKLQATVTRDRLQVSQLRALGWTVILVWECDLKKDPEFRCGKLIDEVRSYSKFGR